jgi:transcriptional regulator with XRE-family HTH domain
MKRKALSPPRLDKTPRQALDVLEERTGLSENELAQALGTSRRTLQRWRAGTAHPQQAPRECLGLLLLLAERVGETFDGDDAVRRWFQSPSRYLRGISPAEAVRDGRAEEAEEALEALRSGIFL